MWNVEFVEGYAADLAAKLNELNDRGFVVRFLLTNGVNRWTIVYQPKEA